MARPVRVGSIYLGLLSVLVAGASLAAQTPPDTTSPALPPIPSARLTVRPRAIATGTRNPAAGEYLLDSLNQGYDSTTTNGYQPVSFQNSVYVPPQCAGAVRCSLVVYLDADYRYELENDWHRELADKYGMMLLTLNVLKPFAQRAPKSEMEKKYGKEYLRYLEVMEDFDIKRVDAGLSYVFRHYAVDPDKIALFGKNFSLAVFVGRNNSDVFSRIAEIDVFEDALNKTLVPPSERNRKSLFYLLGQPEDFHASFPTVRSLRQDGYTVTFGLTLRGHGYRWDDRDRLYRWFRDSWAAKGGAPAPAVADSVPVLTAEAFSAMNAFWAAFVEESDEVLNSHPKEVAVLVGSEPMPVIIVDLPALAAESPSVAAELKAAGLTAQQAEAYWRALIAAGAVMRDLFLNAGYHRPPNIAVEPGSVLAQNIAVAEAHPAQFDPSGTSTMLVFPCSGYCEGFER